MKTDCACIMCFFKQAYDAASLTGASHNTQKKIIHALSREILKFDMRKCPSEMGRTLYRLVRKTTKDDDPFRKIKRRSNRLALSLYPRLKKKIEASSNKLLTATQLAIAGNIIDYGVKSSLKIDKEIEKSLVEENRIIKGESRRLFNYPVFERALGKTKKILYIADNAGEIVFDRILIEQLRDKEITLAVRAEPIINDALIEDALFCGLDKHARIVSTGCDAPGTILKFCSKRFLKIYHDAELIISKGQGNFEGLVGQRRGIFFLFRAKCPVVAKHLRCKLGDVILKKA